MSLAVYPVFETPFAHAEPELGGEALAQALDELDAIAEWSGLTPPGAFANSRPAPDDFDGDPDEFIARQGNTTDWFNPDLGRAALQALAERIRTSPDIAREISDPEDVVAELEDIARVLALASAHNIRFRLVIG